MSLDGQFSSLSLHTPSHNDPHTPLHPVLGEVNGVISWHSLLRQRWEPLFVNNLFLQSLFSGVHTLYKRDKNALNGWNYGPIYQEIYNRPNIDIIKANAEFYHCIMSMYNKN
jgi:hypothetical protein